MASQTRISVLVTGGAGYVGSVLVPLLLERGYIVRVLDNLMYGGESLLPCFLHPRFQFRKGDIRDRHTMQEALNGIDAIVHLAAVVGYPACKKHPKFAEEVNLQGTLLLDTLRSKDQLVIYASTCSSYGAVDGGLVTEETPLNPLTVYGKTKAEAESHLLSSGNVIIYRFATGFGLSRRLRLDLLINDFVYAAVKRRQLIVYEKGFKRSFIHVRDMARALVFALEQADQMRNEVFNVGDDSLNLCKEEIALFIKQRVDYLLHFTDVGRDEDQRNYRISYEKLRTVDFRTTVDLKQGIDELIRGMEAIDVPNHYANA